MVSPLFELYCAFASDLDPVAQEWWEAMAEDAASHDDGPARDSAWYRREALARAREELTKLGEYRA